MSKSLVDVNEVLDFIENHGHYSDNPDYDNGYRSGIFAAWDKLVDMPRVDPVYAAGGCYCKECTYACLLDDESGFYCIKGITMPLNGFCSEGKVCEKNG